VTNRIGTEDRAGIDGFDLNATLSNVTTLRILHNETVDWRGDFIVGLMRVDNMAAVSEPATLVLLLAGAPRTWDDVASTEQPNRPPFCPNQRDLRT
jgi:hypothetical protein